MENDSALSKHTSLLTPFKGRRGLSCEKTGVTQVRTWHWRIHLLGVQRQSQLAYILLLGWQRQSRLAYIFLLGLQRYSLAYMHLLDLQRQSQLA